MEKSTNLTNLYDDVLVEIFSYFNYKDFINLSCTCRRLHQLLNSGLFWKSYTNKLGPKAMIYCGNLQVESSLFYNFFKNTMRVFDKDIKGSSAEIKEPSIGEILTMRAIEASSVDFQQSTDKVIDNAKDTFWSSLGSASEDSEDHVILIFKKNLVIPSEVVVTFFTAEGFYEEGTLEFPSKAIQVWFSFDSRNWEYSSQVVQVNNQHQVKVPILGKVGLARYMKVVFLGKTVLQPTDNLYYVAVENVICYGYKLKPEDEGNKPFNKLLIDSYVAWEKIQPQREEIKGSELGSPTLKWEYTGNNASIVREIIDYFNTGTYLADVYVKLLAALGSQNRELCWELLERNKYLITVERTFIDIFQLWKEFGIYYLQKVVQDKKRKILNEYESLLLILLFMNFHTNDHTNFTSITQVLSDHYNATDLVQIKYIVMRTHTLKKVIEVLGKGQEQGIVYLKDTKKWIFEKPQEYEVQGASIVLFHFMLISTILNSNLPNGS